MKKAAQSVVAYSPVRFVSGHLFGESHNNKHRMLTGIMFVILGILIGDISLAGALHIVPKVFGGLIHAAGYEPYIDHLRRVPARQVKPSEEVVDEESVCLTCA